MSTSLRITDAVMQDVVRACRIGLPREACGYIVADQEDVGLGVRVVEMKNVADNPISNCAMDDNEICSVHAEFDQAGEEPIAAWHCHPTTEPFMSTEDLAGAIDDSLIYLIVSFKYETPKARAYGVQHFIGNTIASQVPIMVEQQAPGQQAFAIPTGPWALLAGNYVRIAYQRQHGKPLTTVTALVISCDGSTVNLNPDVKTAARALPIERIRTVHVIRESRIAAAVRMQLRSYANEVRILMAGADVPALPSLVETLSRAYPTSFTITMEEKK